MANTTHTPGPWRVEENEYHFTIDDGSLEGFFIARISKVWRNALPNTRLIAAAPTMRQEMERYLPVLEWLETMPEIWQRATQGTGIATLNGYKAAITKAQGGGK